MLTSVGQSAFKAAKLKIDADGRLKFEKGMKTLFDYMEAAGDPLEVR